MSNHFHRQTAPDHFIMILHESPGSRYSLVPGDYLSKGSLKETIRLGELKLIGIAKQKKELFVQRESGACKDYDPDQSPAKVGLYQYVAKNINDGQKRVAV